MDSKHGKQVLLEYFNDIPEFQTVVHGIQSTWTDPAYDLELLSEKFCAFYKSEESLSRRLKVLIQAAVELTTQEAPDWEYIGARFLMLQFEISLKDELQRQKIGSFYDKICLLTKEGLYGDYILESYKKEEIDRFETYLDQRRNHLLNYSGLELLLSRYVIRSHQNVPLETPQEMFLGIAMHLAMEEKTDRAGWVKRFYDMLSTLKVTMATPTLSNARKPYHQLSSCFIDTVPDSLDGIYRSIDSFAKVSKFGGGMGLYFGKVRAAGSTIRGFKGAAGGVIRWIKLANDTAVAVDQLGVRQGAVAVYLDAWHKDLPEFLNIRTNNGDDRMKAHDVFPAVCYPNLFWKMAKENIEGNWHLMCPHEILNVKGWALEDSYGSQWEERYFDCVSDDRIEKRVIPIKDIIRLVLKSAVETGTPFAFNRDIVNEANPNSHSGIIYCSNLCTEIAHCYQESDIILATRYAVNTAARFNRPLVICIAMGSSQGGHDGRGATSSYLDHLTLLPGTAASVAAGNEGNDQRHYFNSTAAPPYYNDIELRVGSNDTMFSMEIWSYSPARLTIDISSPNRESTQPVFPTLNQCRRFSFIFNQTTIYVNNIIFEEETGDQLILLRFSNPLPGIWYLRTQNPENEPFSFHSWLPAGSLLSNETFFLNSNPDTTITSPGNARHPLTVAAYNQNNDSILPESGRGYTRSGQIKPDISAPGYQITCAVPGNQYGTATGTGAAAAHAAGIIAMVFEWAIVRGNYLRMTGNDVNRLMISGAVRNSAYSYPNNIWGYGQVEINQLFERFTNL